MKWADVFGYEGLYIVSDHGKVIGLKRRKALTPVVNKAGYLWVGLWKGGRYKARFVHHLVLEAFVGPCPFGKEACHFPDRDPSNNGVSNLRWGSKKENMKDRDKLGRTIRGSRFWSSKMTKRRVIELRNLRGSNKRKWTYKRLALRFGISRTTARQIDNRQCWSHVL